MHRAHQLLVAAFLCIALSTPVFAQATPNEAQRPADRDTASESTKPAAKPDISVRLGGLLQVWYIGGDDDPANTFRIRRAEFKLTGSLSPRVGFSLLADAAKQLTLGTSTQRIDTSSVVDGVAVNQSSRMLLDAFVSLLPLDHLRVEVGQQKIPFSAEGVMSVTSIETIDRAQFASSRERGGSFGDVRDLGVMVRGVEVPHLDYAVAVMNGSGESQNTTDRNIEKSVIGRVAGTLGGLRVGASGTYGGKPALDHARRDRVGGEIEYRRGPLTVRSEYVTGADGEVRRSGYYELLAYRVSPWLQLVERWDAWDPDTRQETDEATARSVNAVVGATFNVAARARVQVNVVRRTLGGAAPATTSVWLNFETGW